MDNSAKMSRLLTVVTAAAIVAVGLGAPAAFGQALPNGNDRAGQPVAARNGTQRNAAAQPATRDAQLSSNALRARVRQLVASYQLWSTALMSSGYQPPAAAALHSVPTDQQLATMDAADLQLWSALLQQSLSQMRQQYISTQRRYQLARGTGLPPVHSPAQVETHDPQLDLELIWRPQIGPTWRGQVPNAVQSKLVANPYRSVPDYTAAARYGASPLDATRPAWRMRQMRGGIFSRSYFFTRGR